MGNVLRKGKKDALKGKKRNQKFHEQQSRSDEVLLLLGPGECGKTTVVKQMKIIYADGFSQEDREGFQRIVKDNAMRSIATILVAMKKLGIEFENNDLDANSRQILDFQANFNPSTEIIPQDIVNSIEAVWSDQGLHRCFMRSNEYQLIDSAQYFIEKIQEIADPKYLPSQDDIIRARHMTREREETDITIDMKTKNHQARFRIVDIGGQRVLRAKWVHEFGNATALIFVASLADYDLRLAEERDKKREGNRMKDALFLFQATISVDSFLSKNVVLFLNKIDLFRKKVALSPIENYFPDYTGGTDYKKGCEYFHEQFVSRNSNQGKRKIYPHLTCATDTEALSHLISSVIDTIIQENLNQVLM